ncbi:MAG: SDR family oxidoreductase [Muribaculaceae bacterium]|nr:SDR family oxidoreductase [Muribaculaceae bacterium]
MKEEEKTEEKVLITGAGGMLGSYMIAQFKDKDIKTLGLRAENDFVCDLTKDVPDLGDEKFMTVIHCAGTEAEENSMDLNYEGTRRLVRALEKNPPGNFVFISSYKVYSRDAGENVDEETNTWASDLVGKSKATAEEFLKDWAARNDLTLTIVRPARMFGNGVKGETLQLFNDALTGKYIHIRGNDARISLVTAFDVARAAESLYKRGGIYNAADGRNPKFIEMVEAMTANAGAKKRMTHLPDAWAAWVWRLCRWVAAINRNLAPDVVENRFKTFTLDGRKLAEATGISYHDTIKVMEHLDETYPYSYKNEKREINHEV